MAFGLVLFWASWQILRDALNILLEATPDDLDLDAVLEAIREMDGVIDVHHVHAWSLTSGRYVYSAHVCVRDLAQDGARVQRMVHDLLKNKFKIYFSTVQIEETCLEDEEGAQGDRHHARTAPGNLIAEARPGCGYRNCARQK